MTQQVFIFHDPEGDKEDFEALVKGLVERGDVSRETLDEVRDDLRPIAEAELDKQGK